MDLKLTIDKVKMMIRQKRSSTLPTGILRNKKDAHVVCDLKEAKQTRRKRPSSTKSHKNDSTPGTSKEAHTFW